MSEIQSFDSSFSSLEDVIVSKDDVFINNKLYNLLSNTNKSVDPLDYCRLLYIKQILDEFGHENRISLLDDCLRKTAPLTQIPELLKLAIGGASQSKSWNPFKKKTNNNFNNNQQ